MLSSTVNATDSSPIRRWLLTAGGALFLVIAIVGVWLPGIPTTGPLIFASMLLGKANPALRERVLQIRILKPYRGYVDGSRAFTRALRCWALLCMWISISLSCGVIVATAGEGSIAIPLCLFGGVIGSLVIVRYQPNSTAERPFHDAVASDTFDGPTVRREGGPVSRSEAWLAFQRSRGQRQRVESVLH